MTAPTVAVTVRLADFGGPARAGVTVTAKLSDLDFTSDGTVVGTEQVQAVTDAGGVAILNVFPNAVGAGLGTRGTTIKFSASIPGSKSLKANAVIPNVACNLVDHIVDDEQSGIDGSAAAAAAAQAARDRAVTAANSTDADVIATGLDRTQTGLDRIATAADRVATGQDRVATGQDRTQTGLDRIATGADRAAVAADRVSTEAARDLALIQVGAYVDEPAGRAAVADGQVFKVQGSGNVAAYEYRRSSSVASTLIAIYPSSAAVQANSDKTRDLVAGPVVGTGFAWAVCDKANQVALGVRFDGSVYIASDLVARVGVAEVNAASAASAARQTPVSSSGFALALTDANGNVAFGVRGDGSMYFSQDYGSRITSLENNQGVLKAALFQTPVVSSGFCLSFTDSNGNVAIGIRSDGSVFVNGYSPTGTGPARTDPSDGPFIYARGAAGAQSVYMDAGTGEQQILAAGALDILNPHLVMTPAGAMAIRFAANRNGAYSAWRMPTDGSMMIPESTPIAHVLIGGQSLSMGVIATPALNTSALYPNFAQMFNTGVRTGLPGNGVTVLDGTTLTGFTGLLEATDVAAGGSGETIASGFGNSMERTAKTRVDSYTPMLFSAHGLGGTAYSGLKKGTTPYANGQTQVTRARALALAANRRHFVPAVCIVHGEADHSAATPRATYSADLLQWQVDYNTDIQAITGQADAVQMMFCQMSSWTKLNGATTSLIPPAQLDAAESSANHHLVCPKYFLNHASDGVHMLPVSAAILGEYYAKAYRSVSIGKKWRPLSPKNITRVGAVITIQFYVPVGPLVLDTALVTNPGNYGFEYSDAASGVTIQSVAITASDTVTVTLTADPGAAASKAIRYAYTGVANAAAGPTTGARGCLRDSDPETSRHQAGALYNWCVHFTKDIA